MFKKPRIKMTRILCVLFLGLFLSSVYAHDENNEECESFFDNDLRFTNIKPVYDIGEFVEVYLEMDINVASRFHRVDLWVVVEMPSGQLYFRTPFPVQPFSAEPQPFMLSLQQTDVSRHVLEFEVLPDFGGDYIIYAVYVKEGTSPMTDSFLVIRSDIAVVTTTFRDKTVP